MVKTFALEQVDSRRDEKDLHKQIRDRCIECYVPRCWMLKDPHDDGQINLKGKLVEGGKRERVQLRRLLFLMEYKELPIGRLILPRCGNTKCINPAHMRVKGWEPSVKKVYEMIDRGILTLDQLKEYYYVGDEQ